jgi:glutathione S-transferase
MRVVHHFNANYALYSYIRASDRSRMELFIIPMTCSFAAHVACLEANLVPTLRRVDRATKRLDDGGDYLALVPTGTVPALRDDGWVLAESAAVLQYIADRVPDARLAPQAGTRARYELARWLNFVTSEIHKKLVWPVFSTKTSAEHKDWARAHAAPTLTAIAAQLADRDFVLGDRFTVADAYLFWTLLVAPHGGIKLDAVPVLKAYVERIQKRPSVTSVLSYELPLFQRERAQAA